MLSGQTSSAPAPRSRARRCARGGRRAAARPRPALNRALSARAQAKLSAKAAAPRDESEAAPAIGFTHLELGVMFAMFALLGSLTGGR